MKRYFYDLTYSPDDAEHGVEDKGWYAQVFGANGVEIYNTPLFATKQEVIADILKRYPGAELLKEFN